MRLLYVRPLILIWSDEKWVAACSPACRVVTAPQMNGAARLKNIKNVIEEKRMGTGLESAGQAASSRSGME